MPPLHLKQEFSSLRAFKEALYEWAIEAHFEPRILKSDSSRVRVGCKTSPNCPFIIRCNWDSHYNKRAAPVAVITVFKIHHNCENDGQGGVAINQEEGVKDTGEENGTPGSLARGKFIKRSTASRLPFLLENVPRLLRVTADTKPIEIRDVILKEYGYELHIQQCRRAKTEILKNLERNFESEHRNQENYYQAHVVNQLEAPASSEAERLGGGREFRGPGDQLLEEAYRPPPRVADVHEMQNAANQSLGKEPPLPQQELAFEGRDEKRPAQLPALPCDTPSLQEAPVPSVAVDSPVRCPYCVNQKWLRSIKDAVEHMSIHVDV